MRKRFDPSDLEPKNGDFASFVEKLNEKSVRELKALQVNDELMREQINDELNGAASNVWSSPNLDQSAPKHRDTVIAQPEDAFKVDLPQNYSKTQTVSSKANTASTLILIFMGLALFFYGGMTGQENLIATAVFFVFVSIVSNIIRQKRHRRR